MPDMESIAGAIRGRMDNKNAARELALRETRQIVRECRSAMAAIQAKRDPSENLRNAEGGHRRLKDSLRDFPQLVHSGYFLEAEQELAEARILSSSVDEKELPTPDGLCVSDEAYILGMADAIGELRRSFLERLMEDDIPLAGSGLKRMEEYFEILMTFDYPDALLPVKRKQDVARSLVEKSRGEFVLAMQMSRLRDNLRNDD